MIDKARTFLDKELRISLRNKKHAIDKMSRVPHSKNIEIQSIDEKISVLKYLMRCLDTVEIMKQERDDDNVD